MKLTILFLVFFCSCTWAQKFDDPDELIPDTFVVGNFNGDGITDTAQLWVPRGHHEMFGCKVCKTEIRFSTGIKTIHHSDDVGSTLENVGDLNGDEIDDIAYCRDWYMGCRRTFQIYLMNKDHWIEVLGMEFIACGDKRSLKSRIQQLPNHQIKIWGDDVDGAPEFRIVKLD